MNRHFRMQTLRAVSLLLALLVVGAFPAAEASMSGTAALAQKAKESRMWMTVNHRRFAITLADNETARAFAAQMPLTLNMDELNGNEKKATLPKPLPVDASRPGSIRNGDLMLYGKDTLVIFYASFDSIYSYTRIGRVDDPAGLAQTLGPGSARISFSAE